VDDVITTQVKLKSFTGEGLWVTTVSYYSYDFTKWKKEQNNKGLNITYIISLET